MSRDDAPGSTPEASPTHAVIDAFVDILADRVAQKLAPLVGTGKPRYADGRNNPLESERAFMDAARRGDFETFIRCRRVTARWSDVERSIETRKRAPRAPSVESADPDRVELENAGVRFRSRKGKRG